jgi:hypothetical protein
MCAKALCAVIENIRIAVRNATLHIVTYFLVLVSITIPLKFNQEVIKDCRVFDEYSNNI